MLFQRKFLNGNINMGPPGPLPRELQGLDLHTLSNLSDIDPRLGYVGQGFIPVNEEIEELKLKKLAACQLQYDMRFQAGFPIVIGGSLDTLQMRQADLINWLVLKDSCNDAIAAGAGSLEMALPLRSSSNNDYILTYQQGKDAMIAMRSYGAALMVHHWDLKGAVRNATTNVQVEAVDPTANWPTGVFSV